MGAVLGNEASRRSPSDQVLKVGSQAEDPSHQLFTNPGLPACLLVSVQRNHSGSRTPTQGLWTLVPAGRARAVGLWARALHTTAQAGCRSHLSMLPSSKRSPVAAKKPAYTSQAGAATFQELTHQPAHQQFGETEHLYCHRSAAHPLQTIMLNLIPRTRVLVSIVCGELLFSV